MKKVKLKSQEVNILIKRNPPPVYSLRKDVRLTIDKTVLLRADLTPLDKILHFVFCSLKQPEKLYQNKQLLSKLLKVSKKQIAKSLKRMKDDGLVAAIGYTLPKDRNVYEGHQWRLLNLDEAAKYLGLNLSSLQSLIDEGQIRASGSYISTITLYRWQLHNLLKGVDKVGHASRWN
jgi:biotin operon repressor